MSELPDPIELETHVRKVHDVVANDVFAEASMTYASDDGKTLDSLASIAEQLARMSRKWHADVEPVEAGSVTQIAAIVESAVRNPFSGTYNWDLWTGMHRGEWMGHNDDQPWHAATNDGRLQRVELPGGKGFNYTYDWGLGGWCVKPEPDAGGFCSAAHAGFAAKMPGAAVCVWFTPNEAFFETVITEEGEPRLRTSASTNGGHGRWVID
ncbi:MAG: hypothetical protein AAGK78_11735 [Planctomycetota bacterium]